jgi:hypothetical protein
MLGAIFVRLQIAAVSLPKDEKNENKPSITIERLFSRQNRFMILKRGPRWDT